MTVAIRRSRLPVDMDTAARTTFSRKAAKNVNTTDYYNDSPQSSKNCGRIVLSISSQASGCSSGPETPSSWSEHHSRSSAVAASRRPVSIDHTSQEKTTNVTSSRLGGRKCRHWGAISVMTMQCWPCCRPSARTTLANHSSGQSPDHHATAIGFWPPTGGGPSLGSSSARVKQVCLVSKGVDSRRRRSRFAQTSQLQARSTSFFRSVGK